MSSYFRNFWHYKKHFQAEIGVGVGRGQAKVYKAKFHGKDVAMKYIPLDHVENGYRYNSYGCHEFDQQEKFFEDLSSNFGLDTLLF